MAKLKLQSVKASTLVEVIVAMVVIMVVFVLATGIYTGIVRSSPSFRQQQIRAKTENVIAQSITDGNWEDEVLQSDSLEMQKTVLPYENAEDLMLITVKALERGKEIGVSRRIVKRAVSGDQNGGRSNGN
jgi:MFS superfamily sulfate permease-like transporter